MTNVRSINTARLAAINSAATQYATLASNHVKGRAISDLRLNQSEQDEADMFYAAYATQIESMVSGVLEESFSVIQRGAGGMNNYETYFLIDEQAARKIRNDAMKQALQDTDYGVEYGKKIIDFVNEAPE